MKIKNFNILKEDYLEKMYKPGGIIDTASNLQKLTGISIKNNSDFIPEKNKELFDLYEPQTFNIKFALESGNNTFISTKENYNVVFNGTDLIIFGKRNYVIISFQFKYDKLLRGKTFLIKKDGIKFDNFQHLKSYNYEKFILMLPNEIEISDFKEKKDNEEESEINNINNSEIKKEIPNTEVKKDEPKQNNNKTQNKKSIIPNFNIKLELNGKLLEGDFNITSNYKGDEIILKKENYEITLKNTNFKLKKGKTFTSDIVKIKTDKSTFNMKDVTIKVIDFKKK